MTAALDILFPAMDPDERRRWLAGRHDWRSDDWEDHCGEPGCEESGCRDNYIPAGDARVAAARRLLVEKLGL